MSRQAIDREIRRIALPAIVANITTPVLGLVDVAITGHLGSATCIGAIAVGGMVFNMVYWLFNFLRMGTVGLTAQSAGAADTAAQGAHLRRSLYLGLAIGAVLIALNGPLDDILLRYLEADDATVPLARTYVSVLIWGAPATLGLFALNGWQLGMQNSRMPMAVSILINLTNIATSLVLVFGFGTGIAGVATGTLVAQWTGFAVSAVWTWRVYHPQHVAWRTLLAGDALRRLLRVNSDIFLRTLCLVAVTTWFTRAGAHMGVVVLAANALLMQLFMFFSYFCDGFGFAGEALAGRYWGAGDYAGLRAVAHRLIVQGALIAVVFSIAYFLAGDGILALLTDQEDVRRMAREYLPWAASVPLCGFGAFVCDGVAVGLTRTRPMLVSMAAAAAVFFTVYFVTEPKMANHGLWLAFVSYLAVRGISLAALLRPHLRKL